MRKQCALSICFVSFFYITSLFGQEDKSQKLVLMLNSGMFFESQEMYQQICDTICPEIDLYYKFRMAQLKNKEDSAAIYLEKMLAEYPDVFMKETLFMYGVLFDMYANLRNYEKGVYTCERMMKHAETNPYDVDEQELALWKENITNRMRHIEQLCNAPLMTLKRKKTKGFAWLADELLVLETKVNGICQQTLFDTGCDFNYIMNRKGAESIGIKCSLSEMNKGLINNTEILMKQVTIDSIEIGNMTLYNVPAVIFENDITPSALDSVGDNSELLTRVDSIYSNGTSSVIGLPVMRQIGKFLIDYKKGKVTFPVSNIHSKPTKESNIFLYESDVYTRLELNGKDFVGILDTGLSDYIRIDTLFYEKYKDDIPIDSVLIPKDPYYIMGVHGLWGNVPYKIPYNPIILFNSKQQQIPSADALRIYPLRLFTYGTIFDGVIGYDFFKRLGRRVLLDFDNMCFGVIK